MTHRLIQLILGVGRFEVGAKIQLGLKNVRECGGPAIDVSGVVDVVNVDAVPKAVDLPIESVCAIEKSIEIISRFQTPASHHHFLRLDPFRVQSHFFAVW